jgi:iron complex transport system permease protein
MSKKRWLFLSALLVLCFLIALVLGRYSISPVTVAGILASKVFPIEETWPTNAEAVLMNIRIPRALVAMVIGAGLSISGATFQGIFRNPLVSPDLLGVASGAGFGAALGIIISGEPVVIQVMAFSFGLTAVGITYLMSRVYKTTPLLMLVLSGVIVGALFSAATSMCTYVSDPYEEMPDIVFWLLGTLSDASLSDLIQTLPQVAIGASVILLLRWRINILSLGDEEARDVGIRTELLKGVLIFCCTVITAASVCVSGLVGWVGLIIPHIGRMLVGHDHRALLPASLLIGASFLVIVDTIARSLTVAELPLGALTAFVGAPVFAYLLRKTHGRWG